MTPMSAPAGWYADPNDSTRERFWTGSDWSQETRIATRPDAGTMGDTISNVYVEPGLGSWRRIPPSSPGTVKGVPAPSLRDLLDKPTSMVFEAQKPQRNRTKPRLIGVALFVIVALVGGIFGVRADQFRRVQETKLLLDLVETSENAMLQWQKDMDTVAQEAENICNSSPEDCRMLTEDPEFLEGIANLSRELENSLVIIAGQFSGERGLNIMFWHKDITLARDRYLDHNAAWVRWMDAASRDIDALSEGSVHDDDIEPTFIVACANLHRIQYSSMYPNISDNNKKRIEDICR